MQSTTTAQLHARRRQLLSQIEDLDQIRRGSITEQFVESVRQDGTKVRRGPYTLYSFKDKGGRTVSRRLSDPAQIARYRSQIDTFRQFQQSTAELLALGETLCDRALEEPATEKKRRTSTRKSRRDPKADGLTAQSPRPGRLRSGSVGGGQAQAQFAWEAAHAPGDESKQKPVTPEARTSLFGVQTKALRRGSIAV